MRSSEWLLLAYFGYVAAIAPFFFSPWKAWLFFAVALAALWALSTTTRWWRDVAPAVFTLAAYREMNWFTPAVRDHHLEQSWIVWDRYLLNDIHMRGPIEIETDLVFSRRNAEVL